MPYISKSEYNRLLSNDIQVDALLAVWADTHGQKKEAKQLFKSMEEKMKGQLKVNNLDEWYEKEKKLLGFSK